MTKYQKGRSGNPNGRPAGSKNRLSGDIKTELKDFILTEWPKLRADFVKLEPSQKFTQFERILSYILPKQRETGLKIDYSKFSDNDLQEIVTELYSKLENDNYN